MSHPTSDIEPEDKLPEDPDLIDIVDLSEIPEKPKPGSEEHIREYIKEREKNYPGEAAFD